MPHGVGHHHHVHHHHRHRNLFHGGDGQRRPITCIICSCAITVVIILSIVLTVRHTASNGSDVSDLSYGPMDTRLISVPNRVFCGTVNLKVNMDSSYDYDVYLYSLSSPPPQVAVSKTFNEQPLIDPSSYITYVSFMSKGSSFNMSACLLTDDKPAFTFYVIKGSQNYYRSWQDNQGTPWEDDASSIEDKLTIATSCKKGNDTYSYSVTEDDFFYLILKTGDDSYSYGDINITISYHQMRYVVDNGTYDGTVLDVCSEGTFDYFGGACSVGLPLTGSTTILLQVVPEVEEWVKLSDSVSVDVYCGARVWLYVLLSLIILVTLVVCFVPLTICLYCLCFKKKKRVTTAAAATAADAGTTTEQSVNTPLLQDSATAPPPPFTDSVYPQSTTSTFYGSSYIPPPSYKE